MSRSEHRTRHTGVSCSTPRSVFPFQHGHDGTGLRHGPVTGKTVSNSSLRPHVSPDGVLAALRVCVSATQCRWVIAAEWRLM